MIFARYMFCIFGVGVLFSCAICYVFLLLICCTNESCSASVLMYYNTSLHVVVCTTCIIHKLLYVAAIWPIAPSLLIALVHTCPRQCPRDPLPTNSGQPTGALSYSLVSVFIECIFESVSF